MLLLKKSEVQKLFFGYEAYKNHEASLQMKSK